MLCTMFSGSSSEIAAKRGVDSKTSWWNYECRWSCYEFYCLRSWKNVKLKYRIINGLATPILLRQCAKYLKFRAVDIIPGAMFRRKCLETDGWSIWWSDASSTEIRPTESGVFAAGSWSRKRGESQCASERHAQDQHAWDHPNHLLELYLGVM